MKRIIIYTITGVACLVLLSIFGIIHSKKTQKSIVTARKETMQAAATKIGAASILTTVKAETAKIASASDATSKEKAIKAGSAKLVLAAYTPVKEKLKASTTKKVMAK